MTMAWLQKQVIDSSSGVKRSWLVIRPPPEMKIFCRGEPAARPYGGTFTVNIHDPHVFHPGDENPSCPLFQRRVYSPLWQRGIYGDLDFHGKARPINLCPTSACAQAGSLCHSNVGTAHHNSYPPRPRPHSSQHPTRRTARKGIKVRDRAGSPGTLISPSPRTSPVR